MDNFEQAKILFLEGSHFLIEEKYEEAEHKFRASLSLMPDRTSTLINLSAALIKLKKFKDAEEFIDKAILLDSDSAETWLNKGMIFEGQENRTDAINCFKKALDINPGYAEAWFNYGTCFADEHNISEAIRCYSKALDINPDYAEAWLHYGILLHVDKKHSQALEYYEKALKIKLDYMRALVNMADCLHVMNKNKESLKYYKKAFSIDPDFDYLQGSYLLGKLQVCDWNGVDELTEQIIDKIQQGKHVINPFTALIMSQSPSVQRKATELRMQNKYPAKYDSAPNTKYSKKEKIRIGYYSADFHNHATSYLMAELFEVHDKNKFEFIAFSFGPDVNDEMFQRVSSAFDQFIDVRKNNDKEVAELSRSMEIDIAVDLNGYTRCNRMGIFAEKAAPVQVSYLVYPGTTATEYIDYLIADAVLIPQQELQHYSENVIYLPDCYMVNDSQRSISSKRLTREDMGLPPSSFVFCCFNNIQKITPSTFDGFMRILHQVPDSVLWMYTNNNMALENLKFEATKRGINAERLVFAQYAPPDEHLARHQLADLFIDTLPYNAHTTCSDALWAGLPVVTCTGRSFASRVAASLLSAIGMSELITSTQQDFEKLAVELADNPARLSAIRDQLKKNRLTTPLFDTVRVARHIEDAYKLIYERYQSDLLPETIYIKLHQNEENM